MYNGDNYFNVKHFFFYKTNYKIDLFLTSMRKQFFTLFGLKEINIINQRIIILLILFYVLILRGAKY